MSKPHDAKVIFQDALELPVAQRPAFLDGACRGDQALRARVEALLAAAVHAGEFLASPMGPVPAETAASSEQPGTLIGHYKLQQQIGEGGFGTVWMAEQQQPVRRQVALKVVKRGMDTRSVVARFEQERQALAMMDHPNIAKVLDGGETPSGRPFFAMELVRGVPITEFCDQQHLDTRERLALFTLVCHAVQHAHQKGIIHRDIKPSNVMVTLHDGVPVPKVIDFGIAKAVHRPLTDKTLFTEFQQMIGTPEYMSPEQAELSGLDIDTRADIYSLGVLLYELLTGTLPFDQRKLHDKGFLEMLRVIREDEPQKPSTRISTMGESSTTAAKQRRTDTRRLGKLLRGDLDWIVMKALEKDRGRRYVSADAFAADVQRYLRDEPVLASPPGQVYRLRKYVRRHRVGVGAGGLVAAALIAGLSAAIWGLHEVRDQRDVARKETTRANTVLKLVEGMLTSADPHENKGAEYRVRQLLDDFGRNLGTQLQTEPEVEASLQHLLASAYLGLGLAGKAAPHVEAALAIRRRLFGQDHELVAESLVDQGLWLHDRGQFAEAVQVLRQARRMLIATVGPDDPHVPNTAYMLSDLHKHLGDLAAAEESGREGLAEASRIFGDDDANLVNHLHQLASVLSAADKRVEADAMSQRALDLARHVHGENSVQVAGFMIGLASRSLASGRIDEAEQQLHHGLAIRERLFGPDHPKTAHSLQALGSMLSQAGRFDEAEALLARALTLTTAASGQESEGVVAILTSQALLARDRGRLAESEDLNQQALEIGRTLFNACHPVVITSLTNLAVVLEDQGKVDAAIAMHEEALAAARKTYGNENSYVAVIMSNLASGLLAKGELARAEELLQQSLTIHRHLEGNPDSGTAASLNNLASVFSAQGRFAEAETYYRQALDQLHRRWGDDHRDVLQVSKALAMVMAKQGRLEDSAQLQQQTLERLVQTVGEGHRLTDESREALASVLRRQGKLAEVEVVYRAMLTVARARPAGTDERVVAILMSLVEVVGKQGRDKEAADLGREAAAAVAALPPQDSERQAAVINNLAQLLGRLASFDEAIALQRRALEMFERMYGQDSAKAARGRANLAVLFNNSGKTAEAEELFRLVIPQLRQALGPEDPQVTSTLNNLAITLMTRGAVAEAAELYRQVIEVRRKVHAGPTPEMTNLLKGLAAAVQSLGRSAAAEMPTQEALTTYLSLFPEGDPEIERCHAALARALQGVGRLAEAEHHARLSLASARRRLPTNAPEIGTALAQLCRVQLDLGDHAAAEITARGCLEIRGATIPADWLTFHTMSLLGAALAGQGKHEEAEPWLREGYEKMQPPTESTTRKQQALERLIQHYEAWGKPGEAAKWRQRLGDGSGK